jgi:methylglutaconyl-CoA hydratase
MPDSSLLYSVDDRGVARVVLNRPELHNAFDDSVIAELSEAFAAAEADDKVRALVLSAEGKSFCAGADLNWMRRMATYSFEENLRDANGLAEMLRRLNSLSKPTIARVQGAAYGGGVGLVSCCDMAVASPAAAFCLSEVKIGLIPATISPYVINAIGERASRRFFTTAEMITAEKACELGLVSELVAAEELDAAVEALLKPILRNGPGAVAAAKRLVLDFANAEINADLIDDSSKRIAATRGSDEGREGLTAFLEKRKPNWIQ